MKYNKIDPGFLRKTSPVYKKSFTPKKTKPSRKREIIDIINKYTFSIYEYKITSNPDLILDLINDLFKSYYTVPSSYRLREEIKITYKYKLITSLNNTLYIGDRFLWIE